MNEATAVFSALRPRLHGIAYRMLGSVAESEDVVQDIWLSWNGIEHHTVENPEAWLVAATTRRAIDRLRAAKARREDYVGIWLPEPILTDEGASPEELQELAGDVSVAFLLLLERLSPEARAAFILREVLDADYPEIADTLGKSEAACRQLVHRAKDQLRDERPRQTVPNDTHLGLMRRFADAMMRGDFQTLRSLLAVDADLRGDGGGKVTTFPKPMVGGQRIAQLFFAAHLRYGDGVQVRLARINGEWSLLRYLDGALESAQTYVTDGEKILSIHVQRNPDKLARIARGLQGFRAD
ncbi:RNA polymerase sigma-70 factor [Luteibacter sp. SG786]|uniref:RNA polymerase sigma-70 factor n=1 Tax=Luteibacter sp. SG786 TaxID=2587130 RepID=UPI001421C684|nr:RNA polymerase sigma-70 factor [Luteibacter sp. SG786]NII54827.1 RNA polymerase sigma-70 factor (ECF subfamily) [Luteibacter sp. SG786]